MVTAATEFTDPPRQLRATASDAAGVVDIAARYGLTERTAGEYLRRMYAAGVIGKRGRYFFGRLSKVDAWFCGEGRGRR